MALAAGSGLAAVIGKFGAQAVFSWVAIGLATGAIALAAVGTVNTPGSHLVGTPGSPGPAGSSGTNGAPGSGTSWGTLNLTFALGGKPTSVFVTGSSCAAEAHGAYACTVSVTSTSTSLQKVTGLSYPANPNLYYAGADPTLGSIVLNPESVTTFTLWFQAVQASGNAVVAVTLLVNPALVA